MRNKKFFMRILIIIVMVVVLDYFFTLYCLKRHSKELGSDIYFNLIYPLKKTLKVLNSIPLDELREQIDCSQINANINQLNCLKDLRSNEESKREKGGEGTRSRKGTR